MSHRDRSPVRTPSPRQPSGKHHWNQWSPYNLTLGSWNKLLVRLAGGELALPTEPRFFLRSVTNGVFLGLSPLACLVRDTSFSALSPTWLHRYYLNWTELDNDITEFNNEMPLTENWKNLILSFYIINTLFYNFYTVQLLWHNLYCSKHYINKGDLTWLDQDGRYATARCLD